MIGTTMYGAADVNAYGRLVKRRRRMILAVVAAFVLAGLAINALTPPVYRATVRIEMRVPQDRSPLTGEALVSSSFQSENVSMYTAADLITNRTLLGQIVDQYGGQGWILTAAESNPALQTLDELLRRTGITPARASARLPGVGPADAPADADLLGARIDWLQSIISVEPVRDTRLVDIHVEHTRPEAAKAIADGLAKRFVDYLDRRSADADTSGLVYLRSQVEALKRKIKAEETEVYGSDHPHPEALDSRVRQLNGTITDLNDAYLKAKADRAAVEARLKRLEDFVPDSTADWSQLPVGNPALDALRRDLLGCETQLSVARGVYKEKHPKLVELESRCASLRENVRGELARAIESLRGEQSAFQARELELKTSLARTEGQLDNVQGGSQRFSGGEADLKVDQALYEAMAAKVEEGRIAGEIRNPPVEIVDAATVDPNPVRPRKVLNLAICLLAGLLAGVGMSLLRESLRRTIRAPEEIEQKLELPVLGMIPNKERAANS